MKVEYLLFNLVVIAGPVVSQFSRQIRGVSRWRLKFLTSGIVMIPYIVWDAVVTGSHWRFNEAYTLDFRLLGLPIGEWLFFITVPFGCLLVWEALPHAEGWLIKLKSLRYVRAVLYAALPVGVLVFRYGETVHGSGAILFGTRWIGGRVIGR